MRFKAKSFISRCMGNPIWGRILSGLGAEKVRIDNADIDISSTVVDNGTKSCLFWGNYERAERKMINDYLNGSWDVIELGSSIGVLSSIISRKIRPTSRLICVEANPNLIQVLRNNLNANAFALYSGYTIINKAICYSENTEFQISSKTTDGRMACKVGNNEPSGTSIETTSLKEIVCSNKINHFSLVCDIEGQEHEMFEHEYQTMQSCKQIIIEMHEVEGHRKYCIDKTVKLLCSNYLFKIIDRIGNVYCLAKE